MSRVAVMAAAVVTAAAFAQQPTPTARDFSGLWFPNGFASQTPDPLPFTAQAREMLEAYEQEFSLKDDPGRYCVWPGMPRAPWGAPFAIEIFHRDHDLTIYWEGYGMYRKVYMADHDPPEALLPSSMGHSLAHWEGDTLVIETTDLKPYPYMDDLPATSDARIVERMRLEEREEEGETVLFLIDDITLIDPKIYTEPVELHAEARHRPDTQLLEYTCTDTLWEEYLRERGLVLPDVDALPAP